MTQWTLGTTSSLGPEKFACYNKTLLYQGYKNNTIKRQSEIRECQNYLVILVLHCTLTFIER